MNKFLPLSSELYEIRPHERAFFGAAWCGPDSFPTARRRCSSRSTLRPCSRWKTMSNCRLNLRFWCFHLQVYLGDWKPRFSFNEYHWPLPKNGWFARYE